MGGEFQGTKKSGALPQLLDMNGYGNLRKCLGIEGIDLFSILCFRFLLWVKLYTHTHTHPKKEKI